MYVCTSVRALTREELQFRRIVLRDAIICIGWMKLLSIFCYTGLYLLVKLYSEGTWSTVIQWMVLVIIPIQVLNGILLFLGALEVKPFALKLALWLSLFMAFYNTILGFIGAIYFIRIGDSVTHFLIAGIFALLSFSICSVLCHDIIIMYTFIRLIQCPPPLPPEPASILPVPSLPPAVTPQNKDDWSYD